MSRDRKKPEGPVEDRFVSVYEAAEELGESRTKVLTRIAHRELESELVAGRTVVTRESVERLKASKAANAA